jgi:hypothetical protein
VLSVAHRKGKRPTVTATAIATRASLHLESRGRGISCDGELIHQGSWTASSLVHFGTMLGSPPGEPGGGITGVTPPPLGCAEMPGSTSGGGQITPLDRDNSSLKLALPVVSPGGTAKPPVLAWQPKFGVDEIAGGAVRSDCADAFVTAAIIVAATIIQGRIATS